MNANKVLTEGRLQHIEGLREAQVQQQLQKQKEQRLKQQAAAPKKEHSHGKSRIINLCFKLSNISFTPLEHNIFDIKWYI